MRADQARFNLVTDQQSAEVEALTEARRELEFGRNRMNNDTDRDVALLHVRDYLDTLAQRIETLTREKEKNMRTAFDFANAAVHAEAQRDRLAEALREYADRMDEAASNWRETAKQERAEGTIASMCGEMQPAHTISTARAMSFEYAAKEARALSEIEQAASNDEVAVLEATIRKLVLLVRIGFLLTVRNRRAQANDINGNVRELLFTILEARNSEEAADVVLYNKEEL